MGFKTKKSFIGALVCTILFFSVSDSLALRLTRKKEKMEKGTYIPVTKKDRCPVCGMFVYPYPKWIAQMQFKDGSYYDFDGPKDFFKFYLNPQKYDHTKNREAIKRMLVRDYYTMKFINPKTAYYVIGSDVLGPMGHELIPFATESEAKTFLKDHDGVRIIRFSQITIELLKKLDRGEFD